MKKYYLIAALLFVAASSVLITGCATLQKYANIQEPKISISSVNIKMMNIKTVDLELTVKVINNNPASIGVAGFDYKVYIEKKHFLEGKQDNEITVKANGTSEFNVPVSINLEDLYGIYKGAEKKDQVKYTIEAAALLDIPVIGVKRFPAKTEGTIPVVRVPGVKVESLKVESISFTGARLILKAVINNPNTFDIKMNSIKYSLAINGADWIKNAAGSNVNLQKKQENTVSLPLEISFTELGRSAYNLLVGSNPLNYHLKGSFNLQTGLPYFPAQKISFGKKDKIKLTK